MRTFLNYIYCFLSTSLHASLMLFNNVKMKGALKYILLIIKSRYMLVSILFTYDSNFIRYSFRHSIGFELDERGK